MADPGDDVLAELRGLVRAFVAERDWDQFHTPKNLAASLCVEAAELLEPFQWLATGNGEELTVAKRVQVRHEMADVLVYLIRLADKLDVDLAAAVREKLSLNRLKYPADRVRGDARKYDEYQPVQVNEAPERDVSMIQAMVDLESAYRAASSLSERRHYKLYYSHVHPFPLLVLGFNPGGETDGTAVSASESYFENYEHDYVHFRRHPSYSLAGPMCALLARALDTQSLDALRQVPATNVIFRRSPNTDSLAMNFGKAVEESKPFLAELMNIVSPQGILFISKTAYDLFAKYHCRAGTVAEESDSRILTPNGNNTACIFLKAQGYVESLGRVVPFFVVGHPSKYAGRAEWPAVINALSSALRDHGISPIESSSALRAVPPMNAYGAEL